MTLAIKQATDFIQAIDDSRLFTQLVDGKFDQGVELFKRAQDGSNVMTSLCTGAVFTVASLVTVPWEAISKLKNGRFYLRGFGFLCPLIALGAFALARYYSVRSLHRMNMVSALSYITISTDSPKNLRAIAKAAEDHFNRVKPEAKTALTLDNILVLIRLHYLRQHCTDLAERWITIKLAESVAVKRDQGHYPLYTELFTINADFLRGSSNKRQEMILSHAPVLTTKEGISLSFHELSQKLDLQNITI